MARIIEVYRCGVEHCPYCVAHTFNNKINYCHAFENPQQVSNEIKTFPLICPLAELEE